MNEQGFSQDSHLLVDVYALEMRTDVLSRLQNRDVTLSL